MSLFDWLEMQWARFNLWLDLMQKNPRRRYTVTWYEEGGRWIISESARTPEERAVMQKARDEKAERGRRRRELMTPEQRAGDDARLARLRERAREDWESLR